MNPEAHDDPEPTGREDRLDLVLAVYIEEVESGVVRDRREWLVRHPEFYDELVDFFADSDEVERIAAPLREVACAGDRVLALDWLDPPEDPEHLGSLAGYEVVDWLGQGGMGVVFKGFDAGLNRFVAIKVLAPQWAPDADARRRFTREARAAAAISHPHVIAIHAVGVWKARPYLVMEYVPGVSLQQRLDAGTPFDLREVLRIGMQVASGLAEAHDQGLVHRDVKPGNIMLEHALERVKITDFGLAKAVDDTLLTRLGTLAGTPRFMAPEQARGERVDRRADLFSLGGVLYALCTSRPAFDGDSTPAVIRQVCEGQPVPMSDLNPAVPGWLTEIVDRLLAKDPAARFPSASELADLLGRHLALLQDPTLPPVTHPWVRRPSRPRRALRALHRSGRAAQALATLLVAAVVASLAVPRETPPPTLVARPREPLSTADPTWPSFDADFRDTRFDERTFRLQTPEADAAAVAPSPRGLQLRVPEGFARPVAVATRFGIRGDFEITAQFEAPPCPAPETGYGLGPELLVKPVGGWDTFASMGRYRRSGDSIFATSHFYQSGGQRRHDGAFPPTAATSGRFRLIRRAGVLRYLIDDGTPDGFRELFRTDFGTGDLEFVRLAATPGGSRHAAEALWVRLTIKAQGLIPPSAPRPDNPR